MAAVRPDSWESAVEEIRRRAEGQFSIRELDRLESDLNAKAERRSRRWLSGAWPYLAGAVAAATRTGLADAALATRKPVKTSDLAEALAQAATRRAFRTGAAFLPAAATADEKERRLWSEYVARASAADKMRQWSYGMREDVRWHVVQAVRQRLSAAELARMLEDRWPHYGQSFSLIAATELGMAYNDGLLLSLPEHRYVTVRPIADGKVCRNCRRLLEGKVFEVLHRAPDHITRLDLETKVWPGKSNMGRDATGMVPCVPLHPQCRHVLTPYSGRNDRA